MCDELKIPRLGDFYNSSKSLIIFIPASDHCVIRLSISIMFFAPKYIAGVRPRSVATVWAAAIGDCACLPAANQLSESATQKSGSVW